MMLALNSGGIVAGMAAMVILSRTTFDNSNEPRLYRFVSRLE
jgi:hypothetical protein